MEDKLCVFQVAWSYGLRDAVRHAAFSAAVLLSPCIGFAAEAPLVPATTPVLAPAPVYAAPAPLYVAPPQAYVFQPYVPLAPGAAPADNTPHPFKFQSRLTG